MGTREWKKRRYRNFVVHVCITFLSNSKTFPGPRASGLVLSRTSEGGRLFYRPSSLPSSFLCFPLPPTRSLRLCLPRTALSSHPIRHPSLLPLFSVLSPHLRVSHITPGIDRAEISGARSVLRSSLGGRENPSCLFSRHYSGDALISIFLSQVTYECYIHQIRLQKQGFSVSFYLIILSQTTPCTGRDASKSENTLKL